jgi:hypothetical protein
MKPGLTSFFATLMNFSTLRQPLSSVLTVVEIRADGCTVIGAVGRDADIARKRYAPRARVKVRY